MKPQPPVKERSEAGPGGVLLELSEEGEKKKINTSETVFILKFDIFVHHVCFALIFIF